MENTMQCTYNGWTNYATWLVNLEIFDGLALTDVGFDPEYDDFDAPQVADALENLAVDVVEQSTQDGIGRSLALSLLNQVNYREIAEHMIEDAM
jgi:hypothetical protein